MMDGISVYKLVTAVLSAYFVVSLWWSQGHNRRLNWRRDEISAYLHGPKGRRLNSGFIALGIALISMATALGMGAGRFWPPLLLAVGGLGTIIAGATAYFYYDRVWHLRGATAAYVATGLGLVFLPVDPWLKMVVFGSIVLALLLAYAFYSTRPHVYTMVAMGERFAAGAYLVVMMAWVLS